MTSNSLRIASTLLLLGAGCVGAVENRPEGSGNPAPSLPSGGGTGQQPGGTGAGGSGAAPEIPGTTPGQCREVAPQVTAARRLTREQYSNTVRDLLGEKRSLVDQLPADDGSEGLFVEPGTLIVTPVWAGNAMTAAEDIAKAAVANMATLVPCPATEGETCARSFIENFGKRAYRRPLTPSEATALLEVFKAGSSNGGFGHGIELVLQAVLQAPSFLYRLELGQKAGSDAGTVKLTPYEIAARLSYGIWSTMPDELLTKAADAGELDTAEQIGAQARRMIADPRARATMVEFVGRWFGLEHLTEVMKDPAEYPEFNEELIGSMRAGVKGFVDDLLGKGDGRFEQLLLAPHALVDARTAPLYGVAAPAGGQPGKVTLPGGRRFGLLTDVGILTAHTFADSSAPIHRGKFVRERLLCTDPPNPPADLMIEPPTPRPGVSTRERLKEHTDIPACSGCHELMDPIGFAFGNFDGLGRWRDLDQGKPVDNAGRMTFSDVDGDYKGVGELAAKLASSAKVRDCVAGTFLRFASGTESAIDECAQKKLQTAFAASKGDLRELVIAITRTDAFRYRRAIAGEVMP